jgi:hypothetical protein
VVRCPVWSQKCISNRLRQRAKRKNDRPRSAKLRRRYLVIIVIRRTIVQNNAIASWVAFPRTIASPNRQQS